MTEANVLTEIQQNPHITAQQISQTLSLNKGQLSVVLKKLEHAGLIQKLPSEQDKRAFELVLTEQGKTAFMAQLEQTDAMLLQELQAFFRSANRLVGRSGKPIWTPLHAE